MNRMLGLVAICLVVAGGARDAAAASWRLDQPSGETIVLTVTDRAIEIVSDAGRTEIPIEQVRSMRVTKYHADPFKTMDRWVNVQARMPATWVTVFDPAPEDAGAALGMAAGVMAAVSLASLVDPEIFLHVIWVEGDVWKSERIRTGFFTPFVEQRLRAAGVRGKR